MLKENQNNPRPFCSPDGSEGLLALYGRMFTSQQYIRFLVLSLIAATLFAAEKTNFICMGV
jgi:hypothetical protein